MEKTKQKSMRKTLSAGALAYAIGLGCMGGIAYNIHKGDQYLEKFPKVGKIYQHKCNFNGLQKEIANEKIDSISINSLEQIIIEKKNYDNLLVDEETKKRLEKYHTYVRNIGISFIGMFLNAVGLFLYYCFKK